MPRNNILPVRLTNEEKARIKHLAELSGYINLSAFARFVLLNIKVYKPSIEYRLPNDSNK